MSIIFKRYNDRYGHQAGDECLSSVAQVLKMAVRAEGDLVARYGGEEFVVVLPGVSLAHATAIAERIQQKIREGEAYRTPLRRWRRRSP